MLASIIYTDGQQRASMKFRDVTDLAALTTMSTALAAYSDAAEVQHSVQDIVKATTLTYGTGAYKSTDQKAVIIYRDLNAGNEDTSVFKFEFPGPKATVFEFIQGKGWRVTAVAGAAIVAALATATGKNLQFIEGWLKSIK